jgi:hypothetical protein
MTRAVRPADYPVLLQLKKFHLCRCATSFCTSSRRKRAAMGGPVVLMWCSTSAPTGGRTFDAQTTSANSSKNSFTHGGDSGGAAPRWQRQPLPPEVERSCCPPGPPQRRWSVEQRVCCPAGPPWRPLLKKERPCCHVDCPCRLRMPRRWERTPSQKPAAMQCPQGGSPRDRPAADGCARSRPL